MTDENQTYFDEDCVVGVTEPDFAAMDANLGFREPDEPDEQPEPPTLSADEAARLSSALLGMLRFIWQGGINRHHAATIRAAAISAALDPNIFGNASYETIATKLGCTKQSISRYVMLASKEFRVHFRRSRREQGRAAMRQAQIGHPNYYHGKQGTG